VYIQARKERVPETGGWLGQIKRKRTRESGPKKKKEKTKKFVTHEKPLAGERGG